MIDEVKDYGSKEWIQLFALVQRLLLKLRLKKILSPREPARPKCGSLAA